MQFREKSEELASYWPLFSNVIQQEKRGVGLFWPLLASFFTHTTIPENHRCISRHRQARRSRHISQHRSKNAYSCCLIICCLSFFSGAYSDWVHIWNDGSTLGNTAHGDAKGITNQTDHRSCECACKTTKTIYYNHWVVILWTWWMMLMVTCRWRQAGSMVCICPWCWWMVAITFMMFRGMYDGKMSDSIQMLICHDNDYCNRLLIHT